MITGRHSQQVSLDTISKVKETPGGVHIDRAEGWGTLFISNDELDGFVPLVGDAIVLFTTAVTYVHGIIIENRVIRYRTPAQVEKEKQDWRDKNRLRKLERYVKHGDALKERAEKLPQPFRLRMQRFSKEGGVEFWIDSAPYEMIVLEGAAALLRTLKNVGTISGINYGDNSSDEIDDAKLWIRMWQKMPYEQQMNVVPDFGEGHSGFTASASVQMANDVLEGREV